jgi:glutamate-1-semialdehyde 2,1-aminomutase
MPTILESYQRLHPSSARLYEQARGVFPGGVTHDTRYSLPFPIFVDRALGCRKWDVDGNEIIDYVSGHGALLLGHSNESIIAAVRAQIGRGTHFGASHEGEIAWGQLVQRLIPSAERVRFTSSGTEATQMAVRLARAFTGKEKLLKFEHHFHGWGDAVTGVIFPGAEYPRAAGVPVGALAEQIILPPNDARAVEQTFGEHDDIAAVILEPTGAHMGRYPLEPGFLRELRELCSRAGVVLIFDEVVTGFRASPGGVQALCGVTPDITTLAKILAGGLPGGAVAGRADLLDLIAHSDDPEWNRAERVEHPGTFNANPLSAAAGCACLQIVAEGAANAQANTMSVLLATGMNGVIQGLGARGCVYGAATILHVLLGQDCLAPEDGISWNWPGEDRRWVPTLAPAPMLALKRGMINEGVDLMSDGRLIVSAVHREAEVALTVAAFERTVKHMLEEGII